MTNPTTHTAQYAAAVVGARVRSFCAIAHPGSWRVQPLFGMTTDHKPGPRRRVSSP